MPAHRVRYRQEFAEFVEAAPVRCSVTQELPCSAARLFAVFEDAHAWTVWARLASVVWTSPLPVTTGTTRTVKIGPIEVDEVFTAWSPGERLTFYFASGNTALIAAGVEDYRVTPLGDDRCRLCWQMALELRGGAQVLSPALSLVLHLSCQLAVRRLAAYVAR